MISIGIDKRCADVITVDAKSYVMLGYDGKITKKGQTLRGRNAEAFLADLKDKYIKAIFEKDTEKCVSIYTQLKTKIEKRKLKAADIQQKAQLNMSVDEYLRKVKAGANRSAAYELASNASPRPNKGDSIYYYVTDPGEEVVTVRGKEVTRQKKVRKFEQVELVANYCYDYDVAHYLGRLDNATKILILVFGLDEFVKMFPDIKIKKEDTNKLDKRQIKLNAVRSLIDGDIK